MFVVGLTGGIGSGKTAVSDRFAALGITVVDADLAARLVVAPGQPALASIAGHFGADLVVDGALDRAALRQRVFADPNERAWLEQLLHPLIADELRRQLLAASSPYALLVSPLLIETGQANMTRRILVVDAPEEVQVARTLDRDGSNEAQVRAIMAAQASRSQRLDAADDVIENTGSLADLDARVAELHRNYLQMAEDSTA